MVVAIAMISFLTWLNTKGIVTGKTVQNVFTSTKVIALIGFIAIGFLATKSIKSFEINKEQSALLWLVLCLQPMPGIMLPIFPVKSLTPDEMFH